jgi:hypothetical protein
MKGQKHMSKITLTQAQIETIYDDFMAEGKAQFTDTNIDIDASRFVVRVSYRVGPFDFDKWTATKSFDVNLAGGISNVLYASINQAHGTASK